MVEGDRQRPRHPWIAERRALRVPILVGMSGEGRVTIARIEGAAQYPKLDTIQKLAAGIGYPVQALLMDDWADFCQ